MRDSRRTAIVLRHVSFEDLGLLADVLDRAGWDVAVRDASIADLSDPALEAAELLIVLGGPIGVYETEAYPFLTREIALLERRLEQGRPVLGICLGCQLIAAALGARVFSGPVKEIGWGRIDLTEAGQNSCLAPLAADQAMVLHWHGDTFDLPDGAVKLASNRFYENQAFSYGRNVLALQFHIEADPFRLEEWYIGHAVELTAAGVSVAQLRAATMKIADRLRPQVETIFERWLGAID